MFVFDDSSPYYEQLVINKTILLLGEDKETTIIDGEGANTVVYIRFGRYVQVRGFTIRNSARPEINWDSLHGVGIKFLASHHCHISDTIIMDTNVGIHLLNYIWQEYSGYRK